MERKMMGPDSQMEAFRPGKVDYWKAHDCVYIEVRPGTYSHSKEVEDSIFDYDTDGNLLGIEVVNLMRCD